MCAGEKQTENKNSNNKTNKEASLSACYVDICQIIKERHKCKKETSNYAVQTFSYFASDVSSGATLSDTVISPGTL